MNYRVIFGILSRLILMEGVFLLLAAFVALFYWESDIFALLISSGITLVPGSLLWLLFRKAGTNMGKKEGYIIVSTTWAIFSLFGAIPFVIQGSIPSFTDAFFETISGVTTTGASILNDIEILPHGLLFWRSLTQWLGGMGIIILSLAILPMLGIGGMQLFIAEVPGPSPDKLHPRIIETAKRLWFIYVILTATEAILLFFGGMDIFDSICHSFSTIATGGYSTKQASIAYYSSPYIHYVIILFMFLAGANFTLSYYALKLNFRKIWNNEEFRYYGGFVLGFSILIALGLIFAQHLPVEQSFREALFQVVSLVTTTGFVTADYINPVHWPTFLLPVILVMMFLGGSAGSTGGGIKIVRIVLLLKNSYLELKRLIHPHAVIPVRLSHQPVEQSIITNVLAFIVLYILIFIFGTIIMGFLGLDLDSAIGTVAATLGNIGHGLGIVGPAGNFSEINDIGKWVLSFLMLIGRLELFTVLVLFSPTFWRK